MTEACQFIIQLRVMFTCVQAILLADVLPSLIVKLTAPFFIHLMSYRSVNSCLFSLLYSHANYIVIIIINHFYHLLAGDLSDFISCGFSNCTLILKPSFSQSLSLHSHLSLAQPHLSEFDHSVFDSHWWW